jgi:hypothetical protein
MRTSTCSTIARRRKAAAELSFWTPAFRFRTAASAKRSKAARGDERVSLAVGLSRVRAGLCYACGRAVEAALLELGSPRCLDCGEGHVIGRGSL